MADTQVGDRLPADLSLVQHFDVGAHRTQNRDDTVAGRVNADVFQRQIRARRDRGAHQEKGGGGNIGGNIDVCAAE